MKKLTIPARLSVAAVFSAACGSTTQTSDARTDVSVDAVTDAPRTDVAYDHACLMEDAPPLGEPGLGCTPVEGMAGRVTCRTDRVCSSAECGPGCEGCQEALFCIPAMSGTTCLTNTSCSPNGCGPGCMAVG